MHVHTYVHTIFFIIMPLTYCAIIANILSLGLPTHFAVLVEFVVVYITYHLDLNPRNQYCPHICNVHMIKIR
jgi:hypothetical protein